MERRNPHEVIFDALADPAAEACSVVIAQAIADIEHAKAKVAIEAHDLKNDYHNGDYRKHGLTKRQCEDKLQRQNGVVLGHELALTVLYTIENKAITG